MKSIEKIKELESKVAELTAGWQRAQADFVNFRKQSAEERAKISKNANSELIYELLPVLDNFQLAAKHVPENLESDNWVQGVRQIERQLESSLFSAGLTKIESIGQEFDPMIHEAVEQVESEKPNGEITDEISSGYKYNDEVLRPAKVKVSAGKSEETPSKGQ